MQYNITSMISLKLENIFLVCVYKTKAIIFVFNLSIELEKFETTPYMLL